MTSFLELTKKRYSVRSYASREVESDKLDYVLECARLAPSAVNRQPWRLVVVESDAKRQALWECYDRPWFQSAPLYIVVCADTQEAWTRSCDGKCHADVDASIITEHICLAAAEQELGTCWVCNFDVATCHRLLGLPEQVQPVAIIPIGYPATDERRPTTRKPIHEIVVRV